jgi:hypothetical protein
MDWTQQRCEIIKEGLISNNGFVDTRKANENHYRDKELTKNAIQLMRKRGILEKESRFKYKIIPENLPQEKFPDLKLPVEEQEVEEEVQKTEEGQESNQNLQEETKTVNLISKVFRRAKSLFKRQK